MYVTNATATYLSFNSVGPLTSPVLEKSFGMSGVVVC